MGAKKRLEDHNLVKIYEIRRKNLVKLMQEKKLNMSQVANKSNYSNSLIPTVMNKKTNFTESIARNIENSLKIPIGYLDYDLGDKIVAFDIIRNIESNKILINIINYLKIAQNLDEIYKNITK